MKDLNQQMKNFIIKCVADTPKEMRKGALAGDIIRNVGIGFISSSPVLISKPLQEVVHIPESINVSKKIQQKQTDLVITRRTRNRITICNQGSDKREIKQRTDLAF